MLGRLRISCASLLLTGGLALAGAYPALATDWDMALAWPDGNFHTKNAKTFAAEVAKATDNRVNITVHAGGSLGFKGPEMLAAVRDGLVPVGDVYLSQQVGEEPILGIESIPYLVGSYEELKVLHEHFRPVVEEVAARYNQKVLLHGSLARSRHLHEGKGDDARRSRRRQDQDLQQDDDGTLQRHRHDRGATSLG